VFGAAVSKALAKQQESKHLSGGSKKKSLSFLEIEAFFIS
jgi:hypothetical protein